MEMCPSSVSDEDPLKGSCSSDTGNKLLMLLELKESSMERSLEFCVRPFTFPLLIVMLPMESNHQLEIRRKKWFK